MSRWIFCDASVRSLRTERNDTDDDGEEDRRNNRRGRMRGLRIKARKMMRPTPFYLALPSSPHRSFLLLLERPIEKSGKSIKNAVLSCLFPLLDFGPSFLLESMTHSSERQWNQCFLFYQNSLLERREILPSFSDISNRVLLELLEMYWTRLSNPEFALRFFYWEFADSLLEEREKANEILSHQGRSLYWKNFIEQIYYKGA